MKKLFLMLTVVLAVALCACQSDEPDGPQPTGANFGEMRIGRMDLSGASQLAFKSSNARSREIEGEYLSAGLYKIDDKGNISAVGVYFTTDTAGNRLEKEYALKVSPKEIFTLTDNYIIAAYCNYYDYEGDLVEDKWTVVGEGEDESGQWIKQEVPYKNLIVRLTDGKVWCIDKIVERLILDYKFPSSMVAHELIGKYVEGADGALYNYNLGNVYKFNLTTENPSFEQVVVLNNDLNTNLQINANGVVWTYHNEGHDSWTWLANSIEFAWPHSGFQILDIDKLAPNIYKDMEIDLSHIKAESKLVREPEVLFLNVNGNPYALTKTTFRRVIENEEDVIEQVKDYIHDNVDVARLSSLSVGNTPGSVSPVVELTLTGTPKTVYQPLEYDGFGYNMMAAIVADNYIFTSDCRDQSWITVIDLNKREWKWLKQLDFKLGFDDNGSCAFFKNRFWVINFDEEDLGIYWFNVDTLEDGFVKFNTTIPYYMMFEAIEDGKAVYKGRNPATGDNETLSIDITTGEAKHEVSRLEMLFETLISLS